MTDVFTKEKRSEIMSRIRSRNTLLEINFCRILSMQLRGSGFRYKRNYKKLYGKPDIVFIKHKLAIFLDGDFWHGRNFKKKKYRLPKVYWLAKIDGNIKRDRKVNSLLRKDGWQVLRFWQQDIEKNPLKALKGIEKCLGVKIIH